MLLSRDVRCLDVADEPIFAAINPGIHLVAEDGLDRASRHMAARVCSSMIVMSGLTKIPPLKPATGVCSASGSISIAIPRGGRPLVIANCDSGGVQRLHSRRRARRQGLFRRDEGAIDIGQDQRNLRPRSHEVAS